MLKKLYILTLLTTALLLAVSGCRQREEGSRVIKVGLSHGKGHSFTLALEEFKKSFETKTDGRYRVKIFYSSQLGGEKEMQEMLTIGSLELTVTGLVNTYEPLFALFEMPYLYKDRAHVFRVMNSEVVEDAASSLQENGIRLLGFYENGFRNITNSVRPITKPSDMEGLMIRTPENPAQIETMKALGAIATPLSFSELYTALIQGVVDGQENPLQNIWYGRLYEAQEHLAMTRHIYNAAYILGSQSFLETLPEDDRKLLKESIDESTLWQLEYMTQMDLDLESELQEQGMKFTYPDLAEFEAATQPAYEVMYEQFGDRAREIVRKIKTMREETVEKETEEEAQQ